MKIIVLAYNLHSFGYFVTEVFPETTLVQAKPLESTESILERLEPLFATHSALLFHMDLTDTHQLPLERDRFCQEVEKRGIKVLNQQMKTMAKSFLHSTVSETAFPNIKADLVGDPEEWLFVKTDRNAGGGSERRLTDEEREQLGIIAKRVRRGPTRGYRRMQRREIGPEIWRDDNYVVERYISNVEGRFLRTYILGNQAVISEGWDDAVVKRMGGPNKRKNHLVDKHSINQNTQDLPAHILMAGETLFAISEKIGLDYGCIDFVLDENFTPYLIDVNTTPVWGSESAPEVTGHIQLAVPHLH